MKFSFWLMSFHLFLLYCRKLPQINTVLPYPVEPFLHEIKQHVDSIHVDPHVLNWALLHFGHQQYIQTGQREVTKQVNSMAKKKEGGQGGPQHEPSNKWTGK